MSSILSVSQLNKYIHLKIQSDLKLKGIAVRGELSNFNVNYRSGHAYFSLKDENCAVKCIMFSSNVQKLKFMPENGMSVLVIGNVDVYERDGVYQISAYEMHPEGLGAMNKGIEQLKDKLVKMGLCSEEIKKPIPVMPKRIAVVTSPTGAALQDIINILSRRYPICELVVFPTLVQGETAPDSISSALMKADRCGADTLILARGGGSLEDLMPFNTEKTAMAVAGCVTPIITAVGHETDTTVVDLVSDLRAPTPSAAAELASPKMSELLGAVDLMTGKMTKAMENSFAVKYDEISQYSHKLKLLAPDKKLEGSLNNLENALEKLNRLMENKINKNELKLTNFSSQLNALSPLNV
ncbi:MAG: exodeoxyribonuclease VII large subunit, partial [Oscillospiraceae bacterium]